jgi:hypothetical protein
MAEDQRHLLFVSTATGYELAEREGDPPAPGTEVSLDDDGRYVVSKVGSSPLPGDGRPCAYLQPLRR